MTERDSPDSPWIQAGRLTFLALYAVTVLAALAWAARSASTPIGRGSSAPLRTPEAMQPVEPPGPSSLAGRGPRSFVGVWAANPQWCARPQGERSPIILTPLRFDAYGRNCDIASIDDLAARDGGRVISADVTDQVQCLYGTIERLANGEKAETGQQGQHQPGKGETKADHQCIPNENGWH